MSGFSVIIIFAVLILLIVFTMIIHAFGFNKGFEKAKRNFYGKACVSLQDGIYRVLARFKELGRIYLVLVPRIFPQKYNLTGSPIFLDVTS